jgi:hypothetical protein
LKTWPRFVSKTSEQQQKPQLEEAGSHKIIQIRAEKATHEAGVKAYKDLCFIASDNLIRYSKYININSID